MISNIQKLLEMLETMSPEDEFLNKEPLTEDVVNSMDLQSFDNEKLCAIVAVNRYLHNNQEMEIKAMVELAKRRSAGEVYPFEDVIAKQLKSFMPLDASNFDLNLIMSQISAEIKS